MILTRPTVDAQTLEAGTGWRITPAGACKGDLCIPLPAAATAGGTDELDVAALADAMRLPLAHDEEHGLWALGPESVGGKALLTAEAADFELPDLEGRPFRLSSLRGRRVLVYAWAPY